MFFLQAISLLKVMFVTIFNEFMAYRTAAMAGNMSVIDAIFAIWIHACILSTCGVPSCKHNTKQLKPVHPQLRTRKVKKSL